jgi:hypothetical protein
MPLFHQYVPAATYCAAISSAGFSTKPSIAWPPPASAAPMRI